MDHSDPLATGKRLPLKQSSRELIAEARQARAEALRSMISAIGRHLRSTIAIHLLPAREPAMGDASPGELHARPDT